MKFEEVHEAWLSQHMRKRSGESKDRLKRGHSHGEKMFLTKVWWPLFGTLEDMHPEYEVADWRGSKFYIDLLYWKNDIRIAFEIKGYGPHVDQTDRTKYRQELGRELFLHGMGFTVIPVAYDELEINSELVKSMVKLIVHSRVENVRRKGGEYCKVERDIIKVAIQQNGLITPIDIVRVLEISQGTARKYLRQLVTKKILRPYNEKALHRVKKYEFIGSMLGDY